MDVAGYVLAGGRSSRMGRDKALLDWHGRTLLEQVAGTVREAVGNVTVIGAPERYAHIGLRVIADAVPDCGPLGGLLTALRDASTDRVLLTACDMPFLTAALLRELAQTAGLIVVPDTGRLHPLCAVYGRSLLPAVESAVQDRRLRMHDLLAGPVTRLPASPDLLANLNTPEDLLTREAS